MKNPKIGIAVLLVSILSWFLYPLYGFVSNQYEVARIPWGWHVLPNKPVPKEFVIDDDYAKISQAALEILLRRRDRIAAPSLSAAVAVDRKIVFSGAVGWRDISKELPATPLTTYRIGSTSKPVGITSLARLVDEGLIDLDSPISRYAKDLPNSAWGQLTARQLASHTAGLPGYEENKDWLGFYQSLTLKAHYDDPKAALDVFDGSDLLHKPKSKFHYSSYDNILLSAVMQEAAGKSFHSVMTSRVFTPLNLDSIKPDDRHDKNANHAVSYQSKGVTYKPWRDVNLSHKLAAGGYIATPSDLAILGGAWLNDDYISSNTRDEFWTPAKLEDGSVNEQDYALGFRKKSWEIAGVGQVTHLNHGGVSKGAQCWLMIIPEYNMTVAISTNRRTDEFFDFGDVYVDLLELFIPASHSASH